MWENRDTVLKYNFDGILKGHKKLGCHAATLRDEMQNVLFIKY